MFKQEEIQMIRNQSRQMEEAGTVSPELLDFMKENPFPRPKGDGEWIFSFYAESGVAMNCAVLWEQI